MPRFLRYLPLLCLAAMPCCYCNPVTLDQYLTVATGNVDWSCDAWRTKDPKKPNIDKLFAEMQAFTETAVNGLASNSYTTNVAVRKLVESMYGVSSGADGKEPDSASLYLSAQRLDKIR